MWVKEGSGDGGETSVMWEKEGSGEGASVMWEGREGVGRNYGSMMWEREGNEKEKVSQHNVLVTPWLTYSFLLTFLPFCNMSIR